MCVICCETGAQRKPWQSIVTQQMTEMMKERGHEIKVIIAAVSLSHIAAAVCFMFQLLAILTLDSCGDFLTEFAHFPAEPATRRPVHVI